VVTSTLIETKDDLKRRIVELELEIETFKQNEYIYNDCIKKLEKIIKSEPITEEQYLLTIERLQKTIEHYRKRLIRSNRNRLECSFCGTVRKKMTMFYNIETGEVLDLCFRGCQHFPEPFKDTEAGHNGAWIRIDPWQDYKREQPRLKKKGLKPVGKLIRQSKLEQR